MTGANTRKSKKDGTKVSSPPSSGPVSCIIDRSMLDTLFSNMHILRTSLGLEPDHLEVPEEMENESEEVPRDIRGLISNLILTVQTITNNLNKVRSVQEEQEKRLRFQEDEMDEIRQRSYKGNIIVSSIPNKSKGKVSLLKSDEQLRSEGLTMQAHIRSLLFDKYQIQLPEEDIQACHRLPKGSVILRIWNRKEGSAWESLIGKIKSPENSEFNVYFNFHLTNKRSAILYECRMLKKNGKIDKYFTDENGSIKIKVKPTSRDKIKITYMSKSGKDLPVTLNKDELLKVIS